MRTLSKIIPSAVLIIFITNSFIYSQKKDTSDYFAIGAFFGKYGLNSSFHGSNEIINSAGVEFEYYKFSDLSFFVQGLYKFTDNDGRMKHGYDPNDPRLPLLQDFAPRKGNEQALGIFFGGRYFLRSEKVNPFLELGFNQLFSFGGGDHHPPQPPMTGDIFPGEVKQGSSYNFSLGVGAGLSFKLSHQIKLEMKYDLYKSFQRGGLGYSLLAGTKFNL